MSTDMVNHPPHYKKYSIECIEITEHLSFCLGNAVKYIYRAGEKGDAIEDIKKALWYLNRAKLNKEGFAKYPLAANRIELLLKEIHSRHNKEVVAFRDDLGLSNECIWYVPERLDELLKKNLPCQHDASMSRIEYVKNRYDTLMIILKNLILYRLIDETGKLYLSRVIRTTISTLEFLENLNKEFE